MALANFAAAPLLRLKNAFSAGHIEEARTIQLSLARINSAVTARFGVPGLKFAMDQVGFYGGPTRQPLPSLNGLARTEIKRLLEPLKLD